MNSLVSLISGQFTRSLIFGAFFPVILFLAIGMLAAQPFLPDGIPPVEWLQQLETQWRILAVSFVAVVFTVFLYYLNTPVIRFLEGYPWMGSVFGKKRVAAWTARYDQIMSTRAHLRLLGSRWRVIDQNHPRIKDIRGRLDPLARQLNNEYPSDRVLILPTRFGNVLRSFETYPLRQYGIDAIVFWPRLVRVADKETLAVVEDARSAVDFFVNCSVLSALLAATLFVLGAITITIATPAWTVAAWSVEILAAALGAFLFHSGSIVAAAAWGDQVKSVFDLFRGDLLKKLGYQQTPTTRAEEREIWKALNLQVLIGDPPTAAPLEYVPRSTKPRTAVTSIPAVELGLTSGIVKQPHGVRLYSYRVTNKDQQRAADVVVIETLPEGQEYIWESARRDGVACDVSGTNPYTVALGSVAAGASVTFSYASADRRKQA